MSGLRNRGLLIHTPFGPSRADVEYDEEEQHHQRERQDDEVVDFDLYCSGAKSLFKRDVQK